ncbi:MAG: HEPN domain-containing protein, partial [Kiritimatiellales bacterium]
QDLAAASALADNPQISDDIVGFHCQQAVEKFLKAVLVKNGVVFRKTHDLVELTELLEDNGLPQPENRDALDDLGPFAVTARYDFFDEPVSFDRRLAVQTACSVRDWAADLI